MSPPSIPALRQLISSHRPQRSRDGYPAHVRRTVVAAAAELHAAGWTNTRLGGELGLAPTTLTSWLRARPAPALFRAVSVIDETLTSLPTSLTLVTPRGYRIEGLDIETAVALLASLG